MVVGPKRIARPGPLQLNGSLRVESQDVRLTFASGLILVSDLDEREGLSALME
jgi:hypothetical protein